MDPTLTFTELRTLTGHHFQVALGEKVVQDDVGKGLCRPVGDFVLFGQLSERLRGEEKDLVHDDEITNCCDGATSDTLASSWQHRSHRGGRRVTVLDASLPQLSIDSA